ncbi:MAG: hypothetical protein V4665_02295 [Patescibacteria group bacterium]
MTKHKDAAENTVVSAQNDQVPPDGGLNIFNHQIDKHGPPNDEPRISGSDYLNGHQVNKWPF